MSFEKDKAVYKKIYDFERQLCEEHPLLLITTLAQFRDAFVQAKHPYVLSHCR